MGASDSRLESPLSLAFRRGRRVRIIVDGRPLDAFGNESVAAAILAAGRNVTARSIKNHRRRIGFCFSGKCGWCLMNVDGIPNVRACMTNASTNLRVKSQNAFPNVENDLFGVLDRFERKTRAGFQYETFLHPRFMRKLYLNILRKFTGLGRISDAPGPSPKRTYSTQECDVLIVGGGIAGIAAATEAAKLGSRAVIIDENETLGGSLRRRADDRVNLEVWDAAPAHVIVDKMLLALRQAGVEAILQASAVGCYYDNSVGAVTPDGLIKIKYRRLIIATGGYDRPIMFEGNELPGVYGGSAVEILLNQYGIKPGLRAVILGDNHFSQRLLRICEMAKIEIAAIVTTKEKLSSELQVHVKERSIDSFASSGITRALGSQRVEAIEVCKISNNEWNENATREVACDFVLVGYLQPTYELQFQAGCMMHYDVGNGGFLAQLDPLSQTTVPGVFVAGDAAGIKIDRLNYLQGRLAGIAAAASISTSHHDKLDEMKTTCALLEEQGTGITEVYPEPNREKCYICPCEDVLEAEVIVAIRKGYDEIEHLKRYTGVGTGICQGKYCVTRLAEVLARERKSSLSDVRIPTQRPPIKSLPLDCYVVEGFEDRS